MSTKPFTKADFAFLLGVHPKTIETYIGPEEPSEENTAFRTETGYHKNPMNGRVTFNENLARTYAAKVTGNDSLRSAELDYIDAEETALIRTQAPAPLAVIQPDAARAEVKAVDAFILPHKRLLSLKEAQKLSGLSRDALRSHCAKVAGKWKITPDELDAAIVSIMAEARKPTKKATARRKTNVTKK